MGGCGWTRCPWNSDLSHVAQDTARAWFRDVAAHCADFGPFWRLFGPFLGHIVELKCTIGLLDKAKSSCTLDLPLFRFSWAFCPSFGAISGEKWLFLAQNCADLGGHLPTWRPRPGPPPVSFWLKTQIWQGHQEGSRMAKVVSRSRRWEGAMAKTER